MVQLNLAGESK